MLCSECDVVSTRTVFFLIASTKKKLTGVNYSETNLVTWHMQPIIKNNEMNLIIG
jgi:hypothetical protein